MTCTGIGILGDHLKLHTTDVVWNQACTQIIPTPTHVPLWTEEITDYHVWQVSGLESRQELDSLFNQG